MKDENIFESVQFINEGIGTAAAIAAGAILGPIAIPLAISTIILSVMSIKSAADKSRIRNVLRKELENNKDLEKLKDKMDNKIKILSEDELAKYIKISDKDKNIINTYDVSIMAIFDKIGKIIAYCLVTPKHTTMQYGYTIIDKSIGNSEIVDKYIQALFELEIGIIGDGIKYFVKHPGYISRNGKTSKAIDNKANYVTDEMSRDILKELEAVSNELYSKIGHTFISGVTASSPEKDKNMYYIDLECKKIRDAYVNMEEKDDYSDENKILNDNDLIYNKCNNKLKNILTGLGYEYNESRDSYMPTSESKYNYAEVYIRYDDIAIGVYTIFIRSSKLLKGN